MTNKKKDYQKPALDIIKMKSLPYLQTTPSGDAEEGGKPDARQNDMDDY